MPNTTSWLLKRNGKPFSGRYNPPSGGATFNFTGGTLSYPDELELWHQAIGDKSAERIGNIFSDQLVVLAHESPGVEATGLVNVAGVLPTGSTSPFVVGALAPFNASALGSFSADELREARVTLGEANNPSVALLEYLIDDGITKYSLEIAAMYSSFIVHPLGATALYKWPDFDDAQWHEYHYVSVTFLSGTIDLTLTPVGGASTGEAGGGRVKWWGDTSPISAWTAAVLRPGGRGREESGGLVLPQRVELAAARSGRGRSVQVSVDLGSTHTRVFTNPVGGDELNNAVEELTVKPRCIAILPVVLESSLDPIERSLGLVQAASRRERRELPTRLIRPSGVSIDSASTDAGLLWYPSKGVPFFGKLFLESSNDWELYTDLKWGTGENAADLVKQYINGLLRIVAAELFVARQIVIDVRVAFPSAMGIDRREPFQGSWQSALDNLRETSPLSFPSSVTGSANPVRVTYASESYAAARFVTSHIIKAEIPKDALYLVLDIGGSTTDMSLWRHGRVPEPIAQLSIRMAGSLVSELVAKDEHLDGHLATRWKGVNANGAKIDWARLWQQKPLSASIANAAFADFMTETARSDEFATKLLFRLYESARINRSSTDGIGAVLPTYAASVIAAILFAAGAWVRWLFHNDTVRSGDSFACVWLCGKGASFAAWPMVRTAELGPRFVRAGLGAEVTADDLSILVVPDVLRKQEVGRGLLETDLNFQTIDDRMPVLETGIGRPWHDIVDATDYQYARNEFATVDLGARVFLQAFRSSILELDDTDSARLLRTLMIQLGWGRLQKHDGRLELSNALKSPDQGEPLDPEPILVDELRKAIRVVSRP